jgi:uncharacterized protein YdeI (YjbR/CyaY-like superfamily)
MRDFFDIQALAGQLAFEGCRLVQAVRSTFKRRNAQIPDGLPLALRPEFTAEPDKRAQWMGFRKKNKLTAAPAELLAVVLDIAAFLGPLIHAARQSEAFDMFWPPDGPWRPKEGARRKEWVVSEAPLDFASIARWRQWLLKNHARPEGAWILIARKGTRPGMAYGDALEEALCWGWIDGRLHRHDERYFALWFAPRRPKSIWSLANRRTVERLIAEGRIQPAGLARVEDAKASGRWKAAYSSDVAPRMTADVRQALESTGALAAFRGLSPSRRLQLLHWIGEAKRPQTRARRIAELPALARENRLPGFRPV